MSEVFPRHFRECLLRLGHQWFIVGTNNKLIMIDDKSNILLRNTTKSHSILVSLICQPETRTRTPQSSGSLDSYPQVGRTRETVVYPGPTVGDAETSHLALQLPEGFGRNGTVSSTYG